MQVCKYLIFLIITILICSVSDASSFNELMGPRPSISGVVQSGTGKNAIPLANATIILYKAERHAATRITQTTADNLGNFVLNIPEGFSLNRNDHSFFYVLATQNSNVQLAAIIGENMPTHMVINELTTVGAAYSMAQFIHDDGIYGKPLGLNIAAGMNDNLVSITKGGLSAVIERSPNGNETNAMRSLGTLSNMLAACVRNNAGICSEFFALTAVNGVVPTNTLQAIVNVAHNPANQVEGLFSLGSITKVYQPYLLPAQLPSAWTLAVKFNDSGSENCRFGGPAKTVFDANGYAWITNNVTQGTPDSSNCIIVLKPNGQPADGLNHTPKSPIIGGGILGTAFGITIDKKGDVWTGDFGWGSCLDCIPAEGAVTQLSSLGLPISGETGYTQVVHRAQGVISDQKNNIWIASFDNNRVVVYPNGNPNAAIYFQEPEDSGPFDIAVAADGSAWVTNGKSSKVSKYILSKNKIYQEFSVHVGNSPKEISFDSLGNAWVASTRDSSIYELASNGRIINRIKGVGGISGPWGVTVDADDNIWIGNFQEESLPMQYSVSKLCGSRPVNCPAGLKTGDPISPEKGYTLPSGGSQVLLHDGTPLNGVAGLPSFNPLMRLTHAIADQAGNVWAANNWKPLPYYAQYFNPGGDGMVVFVGLAAR